MGAFILGMLLTWGPQTLYSLNKLFRQGPSLFYSASFGALQSALRGLEKEGHVTVAQVTENGRAKKIHTITDAGAAAFQTWMHGPLDGDLEVALLARLFHLGLVPEADRPAILAAMQDAIAAQLGHLDAVHAEVMALRDQVPAEASDLFRYQVATLDYGRMSHRAALEWFEGLRRADPAMG